MRLIDADALSQHFAAMQECVSIRDHMYLMGVLSIIDRAPDVDAAPVVHARWEYIEDYAHSRIGWHCTSCRKRTPNEMVAFAKYCPKCGAKMDGGAEA